MLEINASLIFIAILVWILMHILKKIFFEPVLSIMNQRFQLTHGAKLEAEKINQQAQKLINDYQEKIKQAKLQVYENIKKEIALLQKEKNIKIEKAKKEIDYLIKKNINDLDNYINKITPELKKESINIATLLAKSILNRDISYYDSKK